MLLFPLLGSSNEQGAKGLWLLNNENNIMLNFKNLQCAVYLFFIKY